VILSGDKMYKYIYFVVVTMLFSNAEANVQSQCPGLLEMFQKTSGTAHVGIVRAIESRQRLHNQRAEFLDSVALEKLVAAAQKTDKQIINWKSIYEKGACGIEFFLTGANSNYFSAKAIKK